MILATFPAGVTAMTQHGLHQWDYGRKLQLSAQGLPAMVEVHFSCAGMTEAVVRVASVADGYIVTIPDRCLEQTSPITAWVCFVDETSSKAVLELTLPITPRTKPMPAVTPDAAQEDRYNELFTAAEKTFVNVSLVEKAKAEVLAAESLVRHLHDRAEQAQGAAEQAQEKAEDAQGAAERAQGAAERAQGAAEQAQGAAEQAQEKAEDAHEAAEGAADRAVAAFSRIDGLPMLEDRPEYVGSTRMETGLTIYGRLGGQLFYCSYEENDEELGEYRTRGIGVVYWDGQGGSDGTTEYYSPTFGDGDATFRLKFKLFGNVGQFTVADASWSKAKVYAERYNVDGTWSYTSFTVHIRPLSFSIYD